MAFQAGNIPWNKGKQHPHSCSAMFKEGHIPWNKDMKGIHFSPRTQFKKGQIPINKMPVGTITQRKDKGGVFRNWIKTEEPNKWIEYAKFVWISNNGPIPGGFLVHHRDGNSLNDELSNLALVTRKVHFEIHGMEEIGRNARKNRFQSKQRLVGIQKEIPLIG